MEQGRLAGAGCRVPPCCTRAPDALRIAASIRTTGFLSADGFAPTRSFTIDVVDFHPSVDRVKALGGAVAFAA